MKPVIVSGMQPTGKLHIGNYLGALKNFVELQNSGKYLCYFFIADLHSLTESFDPKEKTTQIFDLTANYLAAGLDPKKVVIHQQSQVSAHAELTWIFNTITPMVELYRMTQFKDKIRGPHGPFKSTSEKNLDIFIEKNSESIVNVGLFDYPVLMATDILLYNPQFVPVGHDQLQHLELTRTIVRKFNAKFGKTFIEPKEILTKTPRVMALNNPEKKMSKSSPVGCLFLDDSPEQIKQKVMHAVTDSGCEIKHDREKKPAISNLLEIYSAFSGIEISKLEKQYTGKGYGAFKSDLVVLISGYFSDFRKKKKVLMAKPATLKTILNTGSACAAKVAAKKMLEVKKKVGIAL